MQVVRACPDIHEDQRPEVDDRQAVGIDRAVHLLRNEVIHHAEEAGRQEEADGVMAIPPLRQRVLYARKGGVALDAEKRDGNGEVVDDVQHGNRHDEAQVEPVRHIDMWLLACQDRAEERDEIGNPDDRQPDIDIPFRLRIFASLRYAEQIAGGGHDDEEVVAPEHEPAEIAAEQARPTGSLHHVE